MIEVARKNVGNGEEGYLNGVGVGNCGSLCELLWCDVQLDR